MSATTLTRFLLARIVEDETAAASGIQTYEWAARVENDDPVPVVEFFTSAHRVLLYCQSARQIIHAHQEQIREDDPHAWIVATEVLLKALALPYADHPDFDEAWRV